MSGIVKRFAKGAQVADRPTSLGLIKAQYEEAIEFTGITHQTSGTSVLIGLVAAAIALGMGWPLIHALTEDGLADIFNDVLLCIVLGFISFGIKVAIYAVRAEFFRPEDEPIIFDRKHRKVYVLARDMPPGWRGLFQQWPMYASEYDWDLIDAEHYAVMSANGSTINRYHTLHFLVRKDASDPTIIDSFRVGNSLQVGADSAAPLWEHIRRFMEADGPHLPIGEWPISEKAPESLWDSMGAVGPLGPGYMKYWKSHAVTMVFMHILFPLFLPMLLLWGVCNWLSYKTAIPVRWPQEVLDAIGPATDPA